MEKALDLISLSVELPIDSLSFLQKASASYHGLDAEISQLTTEWIRIVRSISGEGLHLDARRNHLGGRDAVDVSSRDYKKTRLSGRIYDRVDFRCEATMASTNSVFLTTCALAGILVGPNVRASKNGVDFLSRYGDRFEDPRPVPAERPTTKPTVNSFPASKAVGQIPPRNARSCGPDDRVDKVLRPSGRRATTQMGDKTLNLGQFGLRELMSVHVLHDQIPA